LETFALFTATAVAFCTHGQAAPFGPRRVMVRQDLVHLVTGDGRTQALEEVLLAGRIRQGREYLMRDGRPRRFARYVCGCAYREEQPTQTIGMGPVAPAPGRHSAMAETQAMRCF